MCCAVKHQNEFLCITRHNLYQFKHNYDLTISNFLIIKYSLHFQKYVRPVISLSIRLTFIIFVLKLYYKKKIDFNNITINRPVYIHKL